MLPPLPRFVLLSEANLREVLALRFKREKKRAVATPHQKQDPSTFTGAGDGFLIIVDIANCLAIHFHHHVTATNPRLVANAAGFHRRHDYTFGFLETQTFGHLRRQPLHREPKFAFLGNRGDDLLVFEFTHRDTQDQLFLVAQNLHSDFFVDLRPRNDDWQIARVFNFFAVELGNDIADFYTGFLRRPLLGYVRDQRSVAFFHAEAFGDFRRHLLNQYAEVTARDFPLAAQLRQQFFNQIDRNREADADVAAGAAEDRGVDADDFAAQIDQAARPSYQG